MYVARRKNVYLLFPVMPCYLEPHASGLLLRDFLWLISGIIQYSAYDGYIGMCL